MVSIGEVIGFRAGIEASSAWRKRRGDGGGRASASRRQGVRSAGLRMTSDAPRPPARTPRRLLAAGLCAALVALVLVGRWVRTPGPARPSGAERPRSADLDPEPPTTPPGTPRPQGAGLFGAPLARTEETHVDPSEAENEDLPVRTAHGHVRKPKRKHAGSGPAHDQHAIFSADLTSPYPTPAEQALADVSGLDGGSGTIALWVTPLWGEHSVDDATLIRFGDDRVRLVKNVSFLRFEIVDQMGGHVGVGTSIADWKVGEWHYVAATWDGQVIALFVDGAQMMATAQNAPIDVAPDTPIFVGSAFPPGRPVAPAVMAGVTIRDRALTPMAIARRFDFGPRPTQ